MPALPDRFLAALTHEARSFATECAWREEPEDISDLVEDLLVKPTPPTKETPMTDRPDVLVSTAELAAELLADLQSAQETATATHTPELGDSIDDSQAFC